jgi:hypothetical protein
MGPSGGEGLDGLDQALEDALGDFDEMVQGEGSGGEPSDVDILDPMSGGMASADPNDLLYEDPEGEEGEEGSPMQENQGHAQRAEAGGPSSNSSSSSGSEGSEGGQGGEGQQSGGESQDGSQSGGGAESEGGTGGAPPPPGSERGASSSQAGEGAEDVVPIPDDIGDGRDDDIVLRQIREAAMKEKDPVLRERLWDEYRRIRDGR